MLPLLSEPFSCWRCEFGSEPNRVRFVVVICLLPLFIVLAVLGGGVGRQGGFSWLKRGASTDVFSWESSNVTVIGTPLETIGGLTILTIRSPLADNQHSGRSLIRIVEFQLPTFPKKRSAADDFDRPPALSVRVRTDGSPDVQFNSSVSLCDFVDPITLRSAEYHLFFFREQKWIRSVGLSGSKISPH